MVLTYRQCAAAEAGRDDESVPQRPPVRSLRKRSGRARRVRRPRLAPRPSDVRLVGADRQRLPPLRLGGSGAWLAATEAELWRADQAVRALLFSPETDPLWLFIDRVLGRSQGAALRELARSARAPILGVSNTACL